MINEKELLRYGEILTDDNFSQDNCQDPCEFCRKEKCDSVMATRIRNIAYNNHIYYHKMMNGEVVEVKELKA